jgi:5'-deoxynucleotidase YfbR-like HD superfamily hydrolase
MDTEKLMKMALMHDVHELVMGDWDFKMKKKLGMKKHDEEERKAVDKVLSMMPSKLRKEYTELWNEMLACETKEAKLFKEIDKLDLAFQALEYSKEKEEYKKRLDLMWERTKERFEEEFKDDGLKKIFEILDEERKKLKGKS